MRRIEYFGPAVLVVIAALLALIAAPMAYRGYRAARTDGDVREASRRLADNPVLAQLSQASRDLARIVEPSVVHVSTSGTTRGRSGARGFSSSGSGWIWDEEGHIVTNAHVVDGAGSIEVQLYDGERLEAKLVGMELRADVAVLKISPSALRPAMRSTEEPRQGDLVFAFGSPFDFRFSMSSGIISGVGRTAGLADLDYENFIQVDAAINPGNSGGPLTDIEGRVIGMNTAIATGRGNSLGQGQSAGIGLAIPMEMIENIVEQFILVGSVERGYLGVSVLDLEELSLSRRTDPNPLYDIVVRAFQGDGAVVTVVGAESPAEDAGIRPGDVITSIAGAKITARKQIFAVVGTQRPGATVRVEIWRPDAATGSGTRLELDAVLARSDPEQSNTPIASILRNTGFLKISTATPELCAEQRVAFRRGVLVEVLAPRSLAGEALTPGAIITEVEGQTVASVDDLYTRLVRAVDSTPLRAGQVVLTVVSRDGDSGVLAMPLPSR